MTGWSMPICLAHNFKASARPIPAQHGGAFAKSKRLNFVVVVSRSGKRAKEARTKPLTETEGYIERSTEPFMNHVEWRRFGRADQRHPNFSSFLSNGYLIFVCLSELPTLNCAPPRLTWTNAKAGLLLHFVFNSDKCCVGGPALQALHCCCKRFQVVSDEELILLSMDPIMLVAMTIQAASRDTRVLLLDSVRVFLRKETPLWKIGAVGPMDPVAKMTGKTA